MARELTESYCLSDRLLKMPLVRKLPSRRDQLVAIRNPYLELLAPSRSARPLHFCFVLPWTGRHFGIEMPTGSTGNKYVHV
jgi:hypothetical protein